MNLIDLTSNILLVQDYQKKKRRIKSLRPSLLITDKQIVTVPPITKTWRGNKYQ